MVKVYNYKEWDRKNGFFSFSEYPAVREYIEARSPVLEIIETSVREVNINELDNNGRLKAAA